MIWLNLDARVGKMSVFGWLELYTHVGYPDYLGFLEITVKTFSSKASECRVYSYLGNLSQ